MKLAIIGAGLAGLSAALDLTRQNHSVQIFEAASHPGGLASGFKANHWDWALERFYHHWFTSDADILGLIDEIGQSDNVFFPQPITSIYIDGKLYPATPLWRNLLMPISWLSKLRYGLGGVYLRLSKNWQSLEKQTAHQWLTKIMGAETYRVLWEPLLIGKFGRHYKEINMAWMWARLHKRSVNLGYFKGGFQKLNDALCEFVQNEGATIHFNTPARRIAPQPDGRLLVETAAGSEIFDKVLVTTSPNLLSKLAPDLPADYLARLQNLKSMGAVVMVLSLSHQLIDKHYWVNLPKTDNLPFLALVEHTNFISAEHYGGDHIVYCGDYLDPDHRYFDMDKQELLDLFLPVLARFNPNFKLEWVKASWVFKEKYAQPVPGLNHSQHIPPLQTPVSGLYWASMSQIYPWDRGTNYAVEIGRRAAREIMQSQNQALS